MDYVAFYLAGFVSCLFVSLFYIQRLKDASKSIEPETERYKLYEKLYKNVELLVQETSIELDNIQGAE